MTRTYTAIGLMSGTSLDGIDAALIETDGRNTVRTLDAISMPYTDADRARIRAAFGKTDRTSPDVQVAEALSTDLHIAAVKALIARTGQTPDLIGYHGQTTYHAPADGITIQLGNGPRMAGELGIDVVYDFRAQDVKSGGQGAPFMPLYHQVLARTARLPEPVCLLNIGGVSNITWIEGEQVIACDTGPGNALIDDWMLKNTGERMDQDGHTALSGKPDIARIQQWLAHPFFAAPAPKSLDRDAWAHIDISDLSLEDGAATLAMFTAQAVNRAIAQMPARPQQVIAIGGGRHNETIMRALGNGQRVINADVLGWRGDYIEAEGFGYLAARSVLGLPLSLPTTTGVRTPMQGGKLAKA